MKSAECSAGSSQLLRRCLGIVLVTLMLGAVAYVKNASSYVLPLDTERELRSEASSDATQRDVYVEGTDLGQQLSMEDDSGHMVSGSTPENVLQDCSFYLSENRAVVSALGGSGNVQVRTDKQCAWNFAADGISWVKATEGGSKKGTGNAAFMVEPNSGPTTRIAVLTVAGRVFMITQPAADANFATNTR